MTVAAAAAVPPRANRTAILGAMALVLAGLGTVGVTFGVGGLPDRGLLLTSRLPRVAAAILTGAGLAVAGLIMQSLARNRFVDPMTAGTGQAAALGILAVTILAPGASIAVKGAAGVVGALAGTLVFVGLVRRLPPTEPLLVPLVGLVYGGVLAAVATAIAWEADLLQYLEIWLHGEMSGILSGRYELLWTVAALVVAAYAVADRLTILSLGHDAATALGLGLRGVLVLGLLVVCGVAAVTVATVGIVPFVGLVVPALAARILGDDVRSVLPAVALGGATLVLACDVAGRFVRFPYEVPVGTVLGVFGAVVFLVLVATRRG